ncbi:class I SAM-dependent methyltransferase [Pseudovibrio sp. SPO723]|uniref:class I SAM-dependent methyltransferase n=1 Tax=Nesiotobacter zosterae TaxID=392721 RepID=UPI0029C2D370|nr:class I SAM-dependent methyltransferase [Pseudovibrio sp. SPO723]MDX5593780.1 class I SAM-dependent methyltransferase [Pseudovibrio sp. SPO723]
MSRAKTPEHLRAEREALRTRHDAIPGGTGDGDWETRKNWFDAVYETAAGDAGQVPWAELRPKAPILKWLDSHPGRGKTALDVGCGLGDNAEALAGAGYETTAFDVSPKAIEWAKKRFPNSPVAYRVEDLFALPEDLILAFDVVYECYTIQAIAPEQRSDVIKAIASLVKPGGTLLVLQRTTTEAERSGPPWPLLDSELSAFSEVDLKLHIRQDYTETRPDGRQIPHSFLIYEKPASSS